MSPTPWTAKPARAERLQKDPCYNSRMSEGDYQFRLVDILSVTAACGLLAAFIAKPDSNWLLVVSVPMLLLGVRELIRAERRAPTGSEWRRLVVSISLLTVGIIVLGTMVISYIVRSG
jgi:hypothetical protein